MLDLEGRIKYANTFLCDLLGITHDAIAEMSWFEFVFPEDLSTIRELFEQNKIAHETPFRFRLRRIDGSEIWVDIRGSAMQPPFGEPYGILATVTASNGHSSNGHESSPPPEKDQASHP